MPNRDELKAYAEDLILDAEIEYLTIIEMAEDRFPVDENGEHISDEDAEVVSKFINAAVVTIGWMDDTELEYLLEKRTRRSAEGQWTEWDNACGWNNKNCGVYTSKGPLKGAMTRSRRICEGRGWDVEFRVSARPAVKPSWRRRIEFDG